MPTLLFTQPNYLQMGWNYIVNYTFLFIFNIKLIIIKIWNKKMKLFYNMNNKVATFLINQAIRQSNFLN